jgi:predicted XRE-type DNA-binding protein
MLRPVSAFATVVHEASRTTGDDVKGRFNEKMAANAKKRLEWIKDQYLVKGKTQQQIANVLGITRQRVNKIITDAGITK